MAVRKVYSYRANVGRNINHLLIYGNPYSAGDRDEKRGTNRRVILSGDPKFCPKFCPPRSAPLLHTLVTAFTSVMKHNDCKNSSFDSLEGYFPKILTVT